jgi:hypothetical protein
MSEERQPERIEFEEELRRYGRAEPFVPFEIFLSSGDHILVTNSDHLAFTSNSIVLAEPRLGIRMYRKNQIIGFHVHEAAV